jgi:hypothetical protein
MLHAWDGKELRAGFWCDNLKKRDGLEPLDLGVHNAKIDFKEMGWRDIEWISVVYYSNQWQTLVKKEMNSGALKRQIL